MTGKVARDHLQRTAYLYVRQSTPGRIYCPPLERSDLKSGLAILFSMWQCGGHGDAAGSGFVH